MKKKITFSFLAGMAAGIVLVPNWRSAAKKGIKAGIKGGRRIREFSQQAIQDLEDVAAEATSELEEQERQEQERKEQEQKQSVQ
jgi:hypothetical protein